MVAEWARSVLTVVTTVAGCMTIVEWVKLGCAVIGTFVGCATATIAAFQIWGMARSIRMASLANVLDLENDLNNRKAVVDRAAAEVRKADSEKVKGKRKKKEKAERVEILQDELRGYIENYLNAVDRLAFCILRGYWSERHWRAEYDAYFANLVTSYSDRFGPDTAYTNIVDLHNKWQRES